MILGRQRDGDGQNKLLQINGSKDSSSYIINRKNLLQFLKLKTWVLWFNLEDFCKTQFEVALVSGLECSRRIKT